MTRHIFLILTALFVTMITDLPAIGIVIPRTPERTPPTLIASDISGVITDNIARTRITQVFENKDSRPVEADYFFPVPTGADITDFILYMDGKPVRGEILPKDKAADIYRDIVRKMKDPGLIEWSDKNLFRVRIFPIPAHGTQKLEIELTQPLAADQGYYRYHLPSAMGNTTVSAGNPSDTKYTVRIEGQSPIRNLYSPTHKIDTISSQPEIITVTSSTGNQQNQGFTLFYELSEKEVSLSLIAHREKNEDGYFSLRLSPPWNETTETLQQGDFVFVIDTSGSMAESNKIDQAKKALNYCVGLLRDTQRFSLVRFSTGIEQYSTELQVADQSNKLKAKGWIENLEARGGTNISDAIRTGLKYQDLETSASSERGLFTVVFITDGLPTVGETNADKIVKQTLDQSKGNIRIFTFGVGHDVNTRLLDSLAERTRAVSDYVAPTQDLEVPVSRFFDKISRPALYDLELGITNVQATELYPGQLPDLFYGTDLTVFGRYSKPGQTAISLKGKMNGESRTFTFEKQFPAENKENRFVEKLWATRKVAWLLDQIRDNGESKELRKEVEDLAGKYSIVTPYTSYLAMEDEAQSPRSRTVGRPVPMSTPGILRGRFAAPAQAPAKVSSSANSDKSDERYETLSMEASSGASAVSTSRHINTMKKSEQAPSALTNRQTVNNKTFELRDGIWTDTTLTESAEPVVKIKYLSEAWFHLVENYADLKEFLALGENVRIKMPNDSTLIISEDGIDTIDVKSLRTLGLRITAEN